MEQVGISVDLVRVVGDKQIRLDTAIGYAEGLEKQLAEAKTTIERLSEELSRAQDDRGELLDRIEELDDEMSVLAANRSESKPIKEEKAKA